MAGGDLAGGAGAEEGIEDEAAPKRLSAATTRERPESDRRLLARRIEHCPPPAAPATGADPLRAARQDRTLDESGGIGRRMLAAEARLAEPPDVAGISAQPMAGQPAGLEAREPRVLARELRRPGSLPARASVRDADPVEVEEVASAPGQEEEELVGRAEAIGRRLRERVRLRPDRGVATEPAVVGEADDEPLRGQAEALLGGAEGGRARVGVGDVEPDRTRRSKHAGELGEDLRQVLDPLGDGGLASELAGDAVVAEAKVGRAGDDAVDRARGKLAQPRQRVAGEDPVAGHLHRLPR